MVVANLPATTSKNAISDEFADLIGAQIAKGKMPMEIARKLYPEDRKGRLRTYMRIRRLNDPPERVSRRVMEDVKIAMLVGLGPATRALTARAGRGRVDAVKLLYEASGFHNPKIKHEHSGEIRVKVSAPRPQFEDITDADVVEE